jgi:hypothetical protein
MKQYKVQKKSEPKNSHSCVPLSKGEQKSQRFKNNDITQVVQTMSFSAPHTPRVF